ncbi:hypothetical protein [Geminocystis sp.]|uniref:hypothetical protein n=1 Tax=Geminocystis sp. TaxID=2664100 RepID=UPI0035941E5F
MKITLNLTPEQENFYQQYLIHNENRSPEDIFIEGLLLISEKEKVINKINYSLKKNGLKASESTKQLLAEKILKIQVEDSNKIDYEQKKKAEELKTLFQITRSLPDIQNITEDEIQDEINAYREGK